MVAQPHAFAGLNRTPRFPKPIEERKRIIEEQRNAGRAATVHSSHEPGNTVPQIDFVNKNPVFFLDLDEGKAKVDLMRRLVKCGAKVIACGT